MRLFLALELPEAVVATLSATQTEEAIRWVRPEGMHLTVRFLGEVDEGRIPALCAALEPSVAEVHPIGLTIEGAGAFPGERRPRVVWAGVGGDHDGFAALTEAVEEAVVGCGLPRADRAQHPHLTLGRVRAGKPWRILEAVRALGTVGQFTADEVVLFASELGPAGAVYTRIAGFCLGSSRS